MMTYDDLIGTATISTASALPPAQGEPTPVEQLLNGLGLLILLAIVGLCLIALMVVLAALFPTASKQSQAAALASPRRAFFIGLANYLLLGGISLLIFSIGNQLLSVIGLVIVAFLSAVSAIGLTGVVTLIGERLAKMGDRPMSKLKQVIIGTLALALAGLLPFFGWFLFSPIVLMLSFGAAVLVWRNRKQQSKPQSEETNDDE
jgi:hypothetical protein